MINIVDCDTSQAGVMFCLLAGQLLLHELLMRFKQR
jgi:hypothetical protein